MSQDDIRARLIGWDNDKGRAMKAAENVLKRPPKNVVGPRSSATKHLLVYIGSFDYENFKKEKLLCNIHTMARSAPTARSKLFLPFLNEELPLEEVRAQFNKASSEFYKCQADATPMRLKCYEDLIVRYETDTNPATMTASRHKAKSFGGQSTAKRFGINFAKSVARLNHLQHLVSQNLGSIGILGSRSRWEEASSAYHILQTQDPSDVLWDTVIERSQMEAHLLKYNRDSFRAASESPFGNGLLYDAITFSGLSLASDKILDGMPPCEWSHEDQALREFLASFTIPPPRLR
ncbi:hypothetical protein MHU86_5331 [Fragilaria crotonensis]|nr:hypothetical protein MHU86_5331 [Fragilaria crotonensis]